MYPTLLLLTLLFPAQAPADDTLPVTGHPPRFSGAAGVYTIQARAMPTAVRVEEPITLTVRIVAQKAGPWKHPPQRAKLDLFPKDIERDFYIEPVPEEDRALPEEKAWEFVWRLVPKHSGVKEVPRLTFIYYHTAEPRDFKALDTEAIPLEVKPRPAAVLGGPPAARARFERVVQGEDLVAPRWDLGPVGIAALLAVPPVGCIAGYWLWRRLFPHAAERLQRHRSRGLRQALARLRRLGAAAPPADVRTVVADYLRLHVQLPRGEPTPAEVRSALQTQEVPAEAADQAEAFFRQCDEAEFAGAGQLTRPVGPAAAHLLQSLEAQLCTPALP
jgi:hypothetical protein